MLPGSCFPNTPFCGDAELVLCRAGFSACRPLFWCYPNATICASIFRFTSVRPVYEVFHLSIYVSSQERHHPYLVPLLLSKAADLLNRSTSIAITENCAGPCRPDPCGRPPVVLRTKSNTRTPSRVKATLTFFLCRV